jgi:hypothetical protein
MLLPQRLKQWIFPGSCMVDVGPRPGNYARHSLEREGRSLPLCLLIAVFFS